jgi:hypothetical protein
MSTQRKDCSHLSKIETSLLRTYHSISEVVETDLTNHLNQCKACSEKHEELKQIYNCFFDQINKPIHHSVFRFIKEVEKDNVLIAGILLKPQMLDEEQGRRHFTSEIVLTTYQVNDVDVSSLQNISLRRDEVLIRAVQSTRSQETTLFLYSEDKRLYSNVIFALPTLELYFKSDGKGKVDIGQIDIAFFDQLEVMISTNI